MITMLPALRRWILHLAGVGVFLALWEIAGRTMGEALMAPPSVVFPTLLDIVRDGKVLGTIADSLWHMLIGYALACAVGMPLGVAMGRIRVLEVIFHPWVSMLIVTSIATMIPLMILGLGTGFQFRVLVVFVAAVFYIVVVAYEGARDVERRWLDVGRSFSATPLQRFRKIILPALFPYLLTGARIGLGQALRGMVIAEIFIIVGIGGLIHYSGQEISTAGNFSLLLLLMLIALVANRSLEWLAQRLAPWHEARAEK